LPSVEVEVDRSVRAAIRKELNDAHSQGKVIEELLQAAPSDDRVIGDFYRAIGAFHQSNNGGQREAIGAIASLAKVDGAVVMTRDLKLLGFGAKIEFRPGSDVPVNKFFGCFLDAPQHSFCFPRAPIYPSLTSQLQGPISGLAFLSASAEFYATLQKGGATTN
jgi:hypothetical protein